MVKLIYTLISLCVFSLLASGQNNNVDYQVTDDGGEVAREGRRYQFSIHDTVYDYLKQLYFGINPQNEKLACVNGKSLPPFECEDFFTNNYNLAGNTAYLNTTTTISCKKGSDFEDKQVDIRLKVIATDFSGKQLAFVKKDNLIVLPIKNNFYLYVIMEMLYNKQGGNQAEWEPVLDAFDALPTNPAYLIFTSFNISELQFYSF